MNSRLKKSQEKQAILNIVGTIVVMGIILVTLIVFGIPLLINFSLTVEKFNKTNQTGIQSGNNEYLAPPTLNPTYSATNSATLTVTGYSPQSRMVRLYVNRKLADKTDVKPDNSFSFNGILLQQGQNTIAARAVNDNGKESADSNSISVIYSNKQPTLSVDSPQDNQSFSKDQNTLIVKGSTDPGDKVTVNDFWAIVDDAGKFSYTVKLQNGDNSIKVKASDDAGNTTEKDFKVTYSQ